MKKPDIFSCSFLCRVGMQREREGLLLQANSVPCQLPSVRERSPHAAKKVPHELLLLLLLVVQRDAASVSPSIPGSVCCPQNSPATIGAQAERGAGARGAIIR